MSRIERVSMDHRIGQIERNGVAYRPFARPCDAYCQIGMTSFADTPTRMRAVSAPTLVCSSTTGPSAVAGGNVNQLSSALLVRTAYGSTSCATLPEQYITLTTPEAAGSPNADATERAAASSAPSCVSAALAGCAFPCWISSFMRSKTFAWASMRTGVWIGLSVAPTTAAAAPAAPASVGYSTT